MNDQESARRLCAAMIQCAIKDAGGRKGGDRVFAIAWLASTDATKYLDLLDIPQSTLLTRCGWMEWAEEVILTSIFCYDDEGEYLPGFPIPDNQYSIIGDSYKYLKELQDSQTSKEAQDAQTEDSDS